MTAKNSMEQFFTHSALPSRELSRAVISESIISVKVAHLAVEHVRATPEMVAADMTFIDMGADSLDVIEFIIALEEAFAIEISRDDECDITRPSEAVAYVEGRLGKGGLDNG